MSQHMGMNGFALYFMSLQTNVFASTMLGCGNIAQYVSSTYMSRLR